MCVCYFYPHPYPHHRNYSGMMFAESWISDVARVCGLNQNHVRELNMYKEGELTHYNQAVEDNQLQSIWKELTHRSVQDYFPPANQPSLFIFCPAGLNATILSFTFLLKFPSL